MPSAARPTVSGFVELTSRADGDERAVLMGVGAISSVILRTELMLTRVFSVTMYYHFAFRAISLALFGLSASAIAVCALRDRLSHIGIRELPARAAPVDAVVTVIALGCLVRIRVGLNYSSSNPS